MLARAAATPKPLPRVARPFVCDSPKEDCGEIEYGDLPVNYCIFSITLCHNMFCPPLIVMRLDKSRIAL